MIQELKVKNFMSIKEEVELSFEATKDKTFENYHVAEVASGVRLLRFMMVMGANASGKSNLLLAIEFLRSFWSNTQQDQNAPTGVVPFLLDTNTPNECSEFELRFWQKGKKFCYKLKLTREWVLEERLYYYKSVQPTMLVSRSLDENGQSVLTFNPAAVKVSNAALEEMQLKCLRNMSFFAARNQVNISLPIVDDACEWMHGRILPIIQPTTEMFNYAKRRLHENSDLRSYMIDFVRLADFNITDVRSNEIKHAVNDELLEAVINSPAISASEKNRIRRDKTVRRLDMEFVHTVKNERGTERYILPDKLQSEGTKRTLGVETAIFEAITQNALVVMDEFDSSLHPKLIEFCIQEFLLKSSYGQLLVSTHYDQLLATIDDLIRKDEVWFTDKKEDGSTSLYSLADFKGLGKLSPARIHNGYKNGVFGAIPNL